MYLSISCVNIPLIRELGKVTNWFRNLRQTARKKERRALEAEGLSQPSRRGRNHHNADYTHPNKRSRLAHEEEDDDASASTTHTTTHSGVFDAAPMAGEYDYEPMSSGAYYAPHHRQEPLADQVRRRESSRASSFEAHAHESMAYHGRFISHQPHSHVPHPDPDPESRSEPGTESDTAHEAVTPEPQPLPLAASSSSVPLASLAPLTHSHAHDHEPGTPTPRTPPLHPHPHVRSHLTTPTSSSRGSPSPLGLGQGLEAEPQSAEDRGERGERGAMAVTAGERKDVRRARSTSVVTKHPSVDDAMLLLAFHSAPS